MGDVWGQKPHVEWDAAEWDAAKWSFHSSSSGPVVLEGRLLQANAKNCKPGNTSVQLGSLCGMKHTNPPASRGMRGRDKDRNTEGKQRQTDTEESGGYVRLLTSNTETKTFSPLKPKAALQWRRRQWNARQISIVILPLQSFFLSLSSCIAIFVLA